MEAGISRSRWFPDRGSFPGLQTAAFLLGPHTEGRMRIQRLLGFDTSFYLKFLFKSSLEIQEKLPQIFLTSVFDAPPQNCCLIGGQARSVP